MSEVSIFRVETGILRDIEERMNPEVENHDTVFIF